MGGSQDGAVGPHALGLWQRVVYVPALGPSLFQLTHQDCSPCLESWEESHCKGLGNPRAHSGVSSPPPRGHFPFHVGAGVGPYETHSRCGEAGLRGRPSESCPPPAPAAPPQSGRFPGSRAAVEWPAQIPGCWGHRGSSQPEEPS